MSKFPKETEMAMYRKLPQAVEATQWWPPGDERHDPSVNVEGLEVGPGYYIVSSV